jgi:hypothetical protein
MKSLTAVGCILAAFAASACGSTKVITSTVTTKAPSQPASAPTTAASTARSSPSTSSSTPGVARVGGTIDTKGQDSGEDVAITLIKVENPAKGGSYDQPDAGTHYVAVQYRIRNSGSTVFNDSMDNDFSLVGRAGQQYDSTFVSSDAPCAPLDSVNIAPHDLRLGCTYFEVPDTTAKLGELQFAPDSGFSTDVAQWQLGKR